MRSAPIRKRRTTLLFTAMLTLLLSIFATAAPARAGTTVRPGAVRTAAAAGNCGGHAWDGDRLCYIAWGGGSTGVSYAVLHVFTGSNGHDYAAGESYGQYGSQVYFDWSNNGGRNIGRGWLDTGTQNYSSSWAGFGTSDSIYDGPGNWVRACAYAGNGFVCTAWN